MELIVFLTLLGLGSVFLITAAVSKYRKKLFPAGFVFLFISLYLISGSGLEVPSGSEFQYEEQDGELVKVAESTTYSEIEFPVDSVDFSNSLGLVLLAISLYFVIIAPAKTRFLSRFY